MTQVEIDGLTDSIRQRLTEADPGLLARVPLDAYIHHLDRLDQTDGYRVNLPEIHDMCREIVDRAGASALEDYHRLLLLTLIGMFDSRARGRRYPDVIPPLFADHFRKVVAGISRPRPGFYSYSNDSFCKDLGVCRQKLIPCGVQLLDTYSGVARKWITTGGLRQAVDLSYLIAVKMGGVRPLYNMHTDKRQLTEFTPEGWELCYERIALLLNVNPEIRGVLASTWWYDPEVPKYSPRLDFLRKVPGQYGARFVLVGEDEICTRDALTNSPERRQHYEEGRYRPRRYVMIWARDGVIAWSDARRGK